MTHSFILNRQYKLDKSDKLCIYSPNCSEFIWVYIVLFLCFSFSSCTVISDSDQKKSPLFRYILSASRIDASSVESDSTEKLGIDLSYAMEKCMSNQQQVQIGSVANGRKDILIITTRYTILSVPMQSQSSDFTIIDRRTLSAIVGLSNYHEYVKEKDCSIITLYCASPLSQCIYTSGVSPFEFAAIPYIPQSRMFILVEQSRAKGIREKIGEWIQMGGSTNDRFHH